MTEQLLAFDYPHDRGAPDMATMVPIKQGDSTTLNTVHFSNGHVVHLKDDELVELKDLLSNWEQPEERLVLTMNVAQYENSFRIEQHGPEIDLFITGEVLNQLKKHYDHE